MKIRKNFEEDDDYLDLLELAEQDEDFYEDYSTTSEDSFGNESIDKPGLGNIIYITSFLYLLKKYYNIKMIVKMRMKRVIIQWKL